MILQQIKMIAFSSAKMELLLPMTKIKSIHMEHTIKELPKFHLIIMK